MNGDAQAAVTNTPEAPRAPEEPVRGLVGAQIHRILGDIRAGEFGSWPIIIALIIISAFFYHENSNFVSGSNLNNLITNSAGTAVIALGTFFVLLLGEIDLSAASVAGIGGVLVAELTLAGTSHNYSGLVAIPIAVAIGALYGMAQGSFVAFLGVPSFVVTLAGMLAAEGIVMVSLPQGIVRLQDKWIVDFDGYFFSHSTGWIVAIVACALYALAVLSRQVGLRRGGGTAASIPSSLAKIAVVAVAIFGLVAWCNQDPTRGLPVAFVIVLVLYVFWNFIASRTTFGQHVYAVGGNAEAARRAGINVPRIKLIVFMSAGAMYAFGGVFWASFAGQVDINQGGRGVTWLFDAIAGAVIGGTSLFGGRGKLKGVALGVLLIYLIYNGIAMIGWSDAVQFMVVGFLLFAAVLLDTLSRRRQEKLGR
jgi:D-xylose transport system permease protein